MRTVMTILGIVLIVLGVAALVYGGFDYTKQTHEADLGPLEFHVKERDRFEIPKWVGVAAVAAGAVVLVAGRRRGGS